MSFLFLCLSPPLGRLTHDSTVTTYMYSPRKKLKIKAGKMSLNVEKYRRIVTLRVNQSCRKTGMVDDKYDKGLTSRRGCSGKREQVCPSGPIPSSNRSNTGKSSSGKTCVFKTILLSSCKTFIKMSM